MNTRNMLQAALICGSMALGTTLASCDRAVVESTKTTQTPDGTKVQKTTVVEHNDGTISKETESKTVTNP